MFCLRFLDILWVRKLIIEVLGIISVKFIKIKGLREARAPGICPEKFRLGDLAIFENLPGGCLGECNAWN